MLPSDDTEDYAKKNGGLQEARVESDAWKGILEALKGLKEGLKVENTSTDSDMQDLQVGTNT